MAIWVNVLIGVGVLFVLSGLKVVNQYEKGVKFTFGKFVGIMQPGLRLVIPILQSWKRVDMRVKAVDVPEQESITKDNITVGINAVIYYKVLDAEKVIIEVEHYNYAVSQLAQTTMRNIVGEVELDELLSSRDKVSEEIRKIIDKATDPWGIKVNTVDLKDVVLPEQMKRTMAKEAESERERRALIIAADGEKIASSNLMKAAHILGASKGAIHLRTLQNFNDISSDQTNTIVFAVPLETLGALEGMER